MEDLLMKLEILGKIRKSISQTYNSVNDCRDYYECMEMINDIEFDIISAIKESD